MRQIEAADATKLVDRYHLCFALGKALEDRGEYEESFRYYERGNAFKKSESRFDPGAMERNLRLQASLCTREFLAARARGRRGIRSSSSGCRAPGRPSSSRSSPRTRRSTARWSSRTFRAWFSS